MTGPRALFIQLGQVQTQKGLRFLVSWHYKGQDKGQVNLLKLVELASLVVGTGILNVALTKLIGIGKRQ